MPSQVFEEFCVGFFGSGLSEQEWAPRLPGLLPLIMGRRRDSRSRSLDAGLTTEVDPGIGLLSEPPDGPQVHQGKKRRGS